MEVRFERTAEGWRLRDEYGEEAWRGGGLWRRMEVKRRRRMKLKEADGAKPGSIMEVRGELRGCRPEAEDGDLRLKFGGGPWRGGGWNGGSRRRLGMVLVPVVCPWLCPWEGKEASRASSLV